MDSPLDPFDVCRRYILDNDMPEPLRRGILGAIRNRDLVYLCSVSQRVCGLDSALQRILLQVEAFFKKNEKFSLKDVCEQSARASFIAAEALCSATNARLDEPVPEEFGSDILKAQAYIRRVLGSLPRFLDEIPRLVRVTSGATSTSSRRNSVPFMKIRRTLRVPTLARTLPETLAKYLGYPIPRCVVTNVNRVVFVPKNWKTHRTIACEPDGSLPFQLAFDSYAKERLCSFGIDLSDQSKNQELSRLGSIDGSLATIDLSQASDTLAFNTVCLLLPQDWFQFLCRLRAPCYKGPGIVGRYAKFSSMGNGATFSLETLIFAACCYAVGSKRFSVYGDDIIIESRLAERLTRLLSYLGFTINTEKSFTAGPFRESCGAHWFRGTSVTPFYMRGNQKLPGFLYHNINGLRELGYAGGELWELLFSVIKKIRRPLFVPYGAPSISGIHSTEYYCLKRGTLQIERGCARYRGLTFVTDEIKCHDTRALILWWLRSLRRSSPSVPRKLSFGLPSGKSRREWVSWVLSPLPTHVDPSGWTEGLNDLFP